LIEVTFALTILSTVLLSTTTLATRSFRVGQTAGERTKLVEVAQQQMEALRAFRDNHKWGEFLDGQTSPAAFQGILAGATSGCHASPKCFHLELTNTSVSTIEDVPQDGPMSTIVPTSYIEIEATPSGSPVTSVDIILHYGFEALGGGQNTGQIKTTLTNLTFNSAPAVGTACVALPTKDVLLVLDASNSMVFNNWQGQTRAAKLMSVVSNLIDTTSVAPASNHEAIIQFNMTPSLLSDWSGDPAALKTALNGYDNKDGTKYTPALLLAANIFNDAASRPSPPVPKIMVFVSDGIVDNGDTPTLAKAAADDLKNAGVRIYTLGIIEAGDPYQVAAEALLTSMAGNGGSYTNVAQQAQLDAIIQDIKSDVTNGC
jgi:hypothetical protein